MLVCEIAIAVFWCLDTIFVHRFFPENRLIVVINEQEPSGHNSRKRTKVGGSSAKVIFLASIFSLVVSLGITYVISHTPWPVAWALSSSDLPNIQTANLLAYAGGSPMEKPSDSRSLMVVSDHAIKPEVGAFTLDDSGFLPDVPLLNPVLPTSNSEEASPVNNKPFNYVVSPGETLSGIASNYGLKVETLLWVNDLNKGDTLRAGADIVILPIDGVLYEVKPGDTVSSIAEKHKASSAEIAEFNNIDPARLKVGQEIIIPGGVKPSSPVRVRVNNTKVVAGSKRVQAGQMIDGIALPVTGIVTQGFGNTDFAETSGFYRNNFHGGVDIGAPHGEMVVAAHDGTVTFAGTQNGYGKVVYLKGKDTKGRTVFTRYGHLQKYNVKVGDVLKMGEQLGEVGSTGRSTGPHLHFEIRNANNEQMVNHEFYQQHLNY